MFFSIVGSLLIANMFVVGLAAATESQPVACYPTIPTPPPAGCIICEFNYNSETGDRLPECVCGPDFEGSPYNWCLNHSKCGKGEVLNCTKEKTRWVCTCKKQGGKDF